MMVVSRAQQEYKTNFDKRLKRVPTFAKYYPVYLGKYASATLSKVDDTSRKLQEKKAGPCNIVEVQPKTVTLGKNGMLDSVGFE